MGILKQFIRKKENELIVGSGNAIKALDNAWTLFLKQDKYLIYNDKSSLLDLVKAGSIKVKVPWYLFWHFNLKSRL